MKIKENLSIYFKTLGFVIPKIIKVTISVVLVTFLSAFVYLVTIENTALCAAATFLTALVTAYLARTVTGWSTYWVNFAKIGIYVRSIQEGRVPKRAKKTGMQMMWEVYDQKLSIFYIVKQTLKLVGRFFLRKRKPGFSEFHREYVADCKKLLSFYLGNLIPFAGTLCIAYYYAGSEETLFEKLKHGLKLFFRYFWKLFRKWLGWILIYSVIIVIFIVLRYGKNYETVCAFGENFDSFFEYIIVAVDKSPGTAENARAAMVIFLTALDTACICWPLIRPFGDISLIRRFLKCLEEDPPESPAGPEKDDKSKKEKESGKIVFFDIDGTVWDWDCVIPESTKAAIRRLKENGHIPVICSGRSRSHICSEELLSLPFDGIVAACGCHVEVDGKVIYERYVDPSYLPKIISLSKTCSVPVVLEGPEKQWVSEKGFEGDSFVDQMRESMGENFIPLRGYSPDMVVNKFAGDVIPASDFETFRSGLSDHFDFIIHEIVHSDELSPDETDPSKVLTVFEGIIPGTSKADGIRHICDHFGQSPEDAYAIGDSNNDIEMLKCVGTGIAMGNASEALKDIADYITTDIHDNGILNALEHFELI